jgi:hypothetical protein
MRTMLWAASCALLAGCSAATHRVSPETMQLATAPLVCQSADECALWWQRAEDWVLRHGSYKVFAVTDSLIETTGPEGGSSKLAYEITKTANADGSATIGFAAYCDSMFGCRPNPWEAGAKFKQFVRSGIEPSPQSEPDSSPSAPSSTDRVPPPG